MSATPRSFADQNLPADTQRRARLMFCLVAALTLVGVADELHASCGDYVTIRGEHKIPMGGHFASPPDAELPPLPLAGCRGPNCQRQAPAPTNPSRDLPTLRLSERAFCLAAFEPPLFGATKFTFDCAGQPLDGHSRPIEHPPRPVG